MFIDTHCHIHDTQFFPENRDEVYRRAIDHDVSMLCIGTSESDSRSAVEFAQNHENVWAVVGVHPHDTKDGWGDVGELLRSSFSENAGSSKIVGIGEIGLDYFYDNSPRATQIRALEEQLQWAIVYDLPVSFHVREAFEDFWPIYENFRGIRGVLHSFTDTRATLERALSHGLYFGVNGISTFTKSAEQQAMFDAIPLGNVLFETDAPFLTPEPYRGKVNEPAYVRNVAEYHAVRRNMSINEIAKVTTKNAKKLFIL